MATFWSPGPAAFVALFAAISAVGAVNGWVLVQGEVLCHGTDLSSVRCEVAAGFVFISMDPDIIPLAEFLGPILPQLELYEADQMYVVQHRRSDWGSNPPILWPMAG